jgi:hypothetical protein
LAHSRQKVPISLNHSGKRAICLAGSSTLNWCMIMKIYLLSHFNFSVNLLTVASSSNLSLLFLLMLSPFCHLVTEVNLAFTHFYFPCLNKPPTHKFLQVSSFNPYPLFYFIPLLLHI